MARSNLPNRNRLAKRGRNTTPVHDLKVLRYLMLVCYGKVYENFGRNKKEDLKNNL